MTETTLELSCTGCGAKLEYSARDRALRCPYCGTVSETPEEEEEELPTTAQMIAPLSVEANELADATHEHLASGDMTPDHLLEHASISKKERFYVPAYLFHGQFEAQWTASFGFDHQESYTDFETRYDGNRTRQVAVTKYRTVTDWRPVSGSDNGKFAALAYAGHKLFSSQLRTTALVEWNALFKHLVTFDRSYITGLSTEAFETEEEDAYASRAKPQIDAIIDNSVKEHAQGDHQRDWHWAAEIERKRTITAYIPVCHVVYEFEGKSYNVWFSGVDITRQVHDTLPVDKGRQHEIVLGFLPLGAATIASCAALFQYGADWGMSALGVGAAALFGYIRQRVIVGHSKAVRQASLMRRKAASSNTGSLTADQRQSLLGSAKNPLMPPLANPALNKIVLPLAALLLAFIPLKDVLIPERTGAAVADQSSTPSSSVSLQTAAHVASPTHNPTAGASDQTVDSSTPSPVAISAVTLGSALVNDQIVVPKEAFARTDTIYATVSASSVSASIPIVLHWTYGDAKQLVRDEKQILTRGQNLTKVSIVKPGGWPLGNYSLDVVVNGRTISSTRFSVNANATSSSAQTNDQIAMREKCMPEIENVFDSLRVGKVCGYKLQGVDDNASLISAFPAECKGVLDEQDMEGLLNNSVSQVAELEKKLGHDTLCSRAMSTGKFVGNPNTTENSADPPELTTATPSNSSPQPPVTLPDIRVGTAYTYESTTTDSDGKVSSSMSTRQVTAVNDNRVTVTFNSGTGKSSILIYDRQWNFVESGDTANAGLVYNPPIRYFDFPLAPGKKWSTVSSETNKKTGKTRQFTINAKVVGWDSNIGTLDGHAVDGLKIMEDTTVDDDDTRTTGTDISWYVPSLGRSVYSKITGQSADGKQDFKTLRLVNFMPGNIISQVPSAPSTVAVKNQQASQPATEMPAESPKVQPSFDCTRASTAAEVSICVNPELAKLDNQLGLAYSDLITKVPASSIRQYRTDESEWVKSRNERCGGNVECLHGMLQNRISHLKQTAANVLTVPSPAQPEQQQDVAGTPPVSVDSIAFGHSASANGEIRRPDTQYSPTDTIYVSIRSNVQSATPQTFDVLWSASNGAILKRDRMTLTTGPHVTAFNFSDYQGLPNGQYSVGVFVGGKLISNNSFRIAPGFMDRIGNSLKGAVKVEVKRN